MKNAIERLIKLKAQVSIYRDAQDVFTYEGNTKYYEFQGSKLLDLCNAFLNYKLIASIKNETFTKQDEVFATSLKKELIQDGHTDMFNNK